MVEAAERSAVPLRLHNVLLALAGRLDDSALGVARRLAARARADEAAELIAGALIAGRIPVRSAEQRELANVLAAAGADEWFGAQLYVDDAAAARRVDHRFSGGASTGVAEALEVVLQRLPGVQSVHAAWRNTVAGAVPGPMPQRVVLAEVAAGGRALATAYRMDVALRLAGISAAVEVTGPDCPPGDYHRAALAVADPVPIPHFVDEVHPPTPKPERHFVDEVPAPAPGPERQEVDEVPPVAPEPEEPGPTTPTTPAMAFTQRPWDVPQPPEPPSPPKPEGHFADEVPAPAPEPERQEVDEVPSPAPEPVAHEVDEVPEDGGRQEADVKAEEGEDLAPGELFWPQTEPRAAAEPRAEAKPRAAAEQRAEAQAEPVAPTERATSAASAAPAPAEKRGETTTELTSSELGMLKAAIAEGKAPKQQEPEPTKITGPAEPTTYTTPAEPTTFTTPAGPDAPPGRETVQFPAGDLDNPRLSERDRELLKELHAELAKREREQATQVRMNGWEPPGPLR